MNAIHELLWLAVAAFLMLMSPGPNMIYLIIMAVVTLGNPSIEMFDKNGKLRWKQ
ncbi:hypothetical protein WJU16_01250 [Chitinophaga pollutisoli]|uniref:LysE type translocator n=1 Tax=Chitinophaga pollutisoli TaxID=3133966 RepID=A0ABZ2YQD6_9BACT